LLLLAAAARAAVCARTAVPGRDGATYLWMAERCADNDFAALFGTVFHPFYPLLTAGMLRAFPGVDAVCIGQGTAAVCGALAVVPIWLLSRELFGGRAAWWAGLGYALGTWFCRHPAECMSEGPFYLLASMWALALQRRMPAVAGSAGALAYLTRPEGAALLLFGGLWLLARRERRALFVFTFAALSLAALLPLGFWRTGAGFTLTPKAAFNYDAGIGQADDAFAHYFGNLLQLPLAAAEGLGWVALPLMLFGIWRHRPRSFAQPAFLLLAPLLLQGLVIPLLHSHYRFVSGLGVLWFPFAGAAFVLVFDWLAARHRLWSWLLVVLFVGARIASSSASSAATCARSCGRARRSPATCRGSSTSLACSRRRRSRSSPPTSLRAPPRRSAASSSGSRTAAGSPPRSSASRAIAAPSCRSRWPSWSRRAASACSGANGIDVGCSPCAVVKAYAAAPSRDHRNLLDDDP
jgi:hypothetical protein